MGREGHSETVMETESGLELTVPSLTVREKE